MKLDDIMQVLNKEIEWCNKNPDSVFHAEYRKGFINGLIQAKYLISELSKVDKSARDFIKRLKILWWDSSVGFDCLCEYTKEIIMDDESGQKVCDICGRVYAFTTKLELIKDAEIAAPDKS